MTDALQYEIEMIDNTLEDYGRYIIECFDKELPKRNRNEITALCYLIVENDEFLRWVDAYWELNEAKLDLLVNA